MPSEIIAAFLWAQLENIDLIQRKRLEIWQTYNECLSSWANNNQFQLPTVPEYATNNAHMFYLICPSENNRSSLIHLLKENNISAVFHYLSLHKSIYYSSKHDGRILNNTDKFSDKLVRLPMYYDLTSYEVKKICNIITDATIL